MTRSSKTSAQDTRSGFRLGVSIRAGFAIALLLLVPLLHSQRNEQRLRAVAVIELYSVSKARAVPVSLFEDGKFYDAGLYKSTPEPMALEPGTVYEAQRAGAPVGFFTVQRPERQGKGWFANGKWEPIVPKVPAKETPSPQRQDEDAPPVLRRPTGSSSESSRPKPSEQPFVIRSQEEDPDRPVLRRGAPQPQKEPAEYSSSSIKPTLIVAVSDAQATETRPFHFNLSKGEEERLRAQMLKFARLEVSRAKSRTSPPPRFKPAVLDFRAFDLDLNNRPVLVVAAKNAEAQVTCLARLTPDDELRKLLCSDASSGQLQLIDAIDADGDGRGELLFRSVEGERTSYRIYSVGRHQVSLLLESGITSR